MFRKDRSDTLVLSRRPPARRTPNWRWVSERARGLLDLLLLWQARYEQRRHLLELSDHQLKDIGLTRADIEQEAAKPVWWR
jgi:uncharacterized protein YjiS (DUF1127 family)